MSKFYWHLKIFLQEVEEGKAGTNGDGRKRLREVNTQCNIQMTYRGIEHLKSG